jgi:flagellum-specific peptidoglycan hydrolase FlgJ
VKVQTVSKHLFMAASLLAAPVSMQFERPANAHPVRKPAEQPEKSEDPRTARLREFFCALRCPVKELAEDFVQAADDNHLDWRLLPSISVIESGGGKAFKNNNLFGWNNGEAPFITVRTGIHEVAFQLGKSARYRNQDVGGKLRFYNPDPEYAGKVVGVMQMISKTEQLVPVSRKAVARLARMTLN